MTRRSGLHPRRRRLARRRRPVDRRGRPRDAGQPKDAGSISGVWSLASSGVEVALGRDDGEVESTRPAERGTPQRHGELGAGVRGAHRASSTSNVPERILPRLEPRRRRHRHGLRARYHRGQHCGLVPVGVEEDRDELRIARERGGAAKRTTNTTAPRARVTSTRTMSGASPLSPSSSSTTTGSAASAGETAASAAATPARTTSERICRSCATARTSSTIARVRLTAVTRQLWAPWRLEYVAAGGRAGRLRLLRRRGGRRRGAARRRTAASGVRAPEQLPYSSGHLMVAPVGTSATSPSSTATRRSRSTRSRRRRMARSRGVYAPEGFNLGWNLGRVAGAGIVDHVHLHVVPRWAGDTNFMPVLADVKVLPEHLARPRRRLAAAWPRRWPAARAARPRRALERIHAARGGPPPGRGPALRDLARAVRARTRPSSSGCASRDEASRVRRARSAICSRGSTGPAAPVGGLELGDARRPPRPAGRARARARPRAGGGGHGADRRAPAGARRR